MAHAPLPVAASNRHGERRERDREIQYQIQKIEREGEREGNDGAIDCQMKRKMGEIKVKGAKGENDHATQVPPCDMYTTAMDALIGRDGYLMA